MPQSFKAHRDHSTLTASLNNMHGMAIQVPSRLPSLFPARSNHSNMSTCIAMGGQLIASHLGSLVAAAAVIFPGRRAPRAQGGPVSVCGSAGQRQAVQGQVGHAGPDALGAAGRGGGGGGGCTPMAIAGGCRRGGVGRKWRGARAEGRGACKQPCTQAVVCVVQSGATSWSQRRQSCLESCLLWALLRSLVIEQTTHR